MARATRPAATSSRSGPTRPRCAICSRAPASRSSCHRDRRAGMVQRDVLRGATGGRDVRWLAQASARHGRARGAASHLCLARAGDARRPSRGRAGDPHRALDARLRSLALPPLLALVVAARDGGGRGQRFPAPPDLRARAGGGGARERDSQRRFQPVRERRADAARRARRAVAPGRDRAARTAQGDRSGARRAGHGRWTAARHRRRRTIPARAREAGRRAGPPRSRALLGIPKRSRDRSSPSSTPSSAARARRDCPWVCSKEWRWDAR